MYHASLEFMPGQQVFGQNMILTTPFIADCKSIIRRKQQQIEKNQYENKNTTLHNYRVCDKVLVRDKKQIHMRSRTKALTQ